MNTVANTYKTTNGAGFCCEPQAKNRNARSLPTQNVDYERLQYYYHSDHLGSASYITNLDGEVVQHVEYIPFGEVFIEERNNTWNTPYLFNGKELDEETGLYYYGARYYNPRISLWYGVDPMADKYPAHSPYCYTMNNPVMLVDPDGRKVVNTAKKDTKEYQQIEYAMKIYKQTSPQVYERLEKSSTNFKVGVGKLNPDAAYKADYVGKFQKGLCESKYDLSSSGLRVKDGDLQMWTSQEERKVQYDAGVNVDYYKNVSFEEAKGSAILDGDVIITIDQSLVGQDKEFSAIVGHEFGHADFSLERTEEAFYWSETDKSGTGGHGPGNPNGIYADQQEQQVRKNYRDAKKVVKQQNKAQ